MDKRPTKWLGVLKRLMRFLLALFGADRLEVIGIEIVDGEALMIEEAILPDELLAYVNIDDSVIYVTKGYEEEVAEDLGADVDGNIWHMKEDGALVARERKELEVQNFYNQVAIVKWTYLKGFKCEQHPAGFWLNIYRRRSGRFYRSHKTTAAGRWCIYRRAGRCKLAVIEVEGEYWTRPRGRGRRKNEKHKLGACVG